MKYIIYDIAAKQWFIGSSYEGSYFSGEETAIYFDSEQEAINRLQTEYKYKQSDFENKIIAILPIYNFKNKTT